MRELILEMRENVVMLFDYLGGKMEGGKIVKDVDKAKYRN